MISPEGSGLKGEVERSSEWDGIGEEVTLRQATPKVESEGARDKDAVGRARERVVQAYDRRLELADDTEKKERDFAQKVGEIDCYLMENSENKEAMAGYVVDLAGVLADVKPAALISISPVDLNLDAKDFARMVEGVGLQIALDGEDGHFFVAKDVEVAEQLKQGFHELWENNKTGDVEGRVEIDRKIGRLLGYPETAVNQDFKKPTTLAGRIKNAFKKQGSEDLDSRYYVHNPKYEDEEFEQYEKPIHKFMDKYCPEATKVLKNKKTPKGGSYRW